MADAYKGLTIEIDGNTTKLSAALRSVNSEVRSTATQLKDVNRALKLDPGNVQLTEQRFRLASKAVAEQEQKLATLEQAEREYSSQSGTLTAEQQAGYERVQREIVKTKDALAKAKAEMESAAAQNTQLSQSLAQAGKSLSDFSAKYKGAGEAAKSIGSKVTAVSAGLGTAAYAAFESFEDGANTAVRSAGAVGDAADEIRESVKQVALSAPGDLQTVGQAVGDVNTHFQLTGQALNDTSTQFLKFSKVTGADVSSSIENVAMSMKAFNVDASQTGDVLDLLAKTSTSTGISVETLMGDLNTNGATFRAMGLSIQDSITLLGDFEAAGVPADQMLTGLKKAAANCSKEGTDLGSTLRQLVTDLQDPAKQADATKTAFDLFGTRAAQSFVDAAESGRINLDDLGGSLDSAKGFVSDLKDETTTAGDRIQGAFKKMTVAGAGIGEDLSPIVEDVAGVVTTVAQALDGMSDGEKRAVATGIELAAGAGTLLTIGGKSIEVVGKVGDGLTKLSGTMPKTSGSVGSLVAKLGPGAGLAGVGLTVAGVLVGGVVSGLVSAKERTDKLEKSTSDLNAAVDRTVGLSDYGARADTAGESAGKAAKSVDELAESFEKSAEKMGDNTSTAEATIAQLSTAQQIVDDSIGKTDLSTDAQGRLQWALSTLNDQLGLNITSQDVLNGKYTDADGNVQDLRQSIDELVESKERDARMSAITENLTEAYKDQSDAAATLADCQNKYNDEVDATLGLYPNWTREQAEASVNQRKVGQDLQEAQKQYDGASDAVSRYSEQLGDAASAESQTDDALQNWVNGTGPLFEAQLSSHGQSLSELSTDLHALGASADDMGKLTSDQLEKLARDYDGTTTSIVSDLTEWGVGMDDSAAKAAQAAGDIKSALDGMDGLGDRLGNVGVNVSDLSQALADAGVSTETLNEIGSDNLGALAEACDGNMGQMVTAIQLYNAQPLVNKDGSINVNDVPLVDAQGNLYTWNGSQLLDKSGNAVVDDVSVTDAQGHKVEWNGSNLLYKSADGEVHDLMSSSIRKRDEWNRTGLRDYNATGRVDIFANIKETVSKIFGNARGGIRPHADGGIVPRFHAQGGAIATRAMPLDIVGEAGAEAIVPLTNRRYSLPFARTIAEQMRDGQPSEAAQVTAWLARNLPEIISEWTPVMGDRDFTRAVNRAVRASA